VNCASGTVWNYLTEKCETEVKATIKVSSALTYFLRCRDAEFSVATGDGFKSGSSIKDLQWSLSVDEEVTDYVSDIDAFNEFLRTTEVASKGQSKLTLSKLATELILRPVVLKVTASGFEPSHNSPVSHTLSVTLLKEAIEALTNYESSYFIFSKDGLTTDIMVSYPECVNKGPADVDASKLACALYDSRWFSQGSVQNCNIPPNSLGNGEQFYLRVRHTPHKYQSMLMATITIQTQQVETSCRILGGDYFYITNTKAF